MDATYRVRYRVHQADGAGSAMVVEDTTGVLYLFSNGALQVRLNSLATWQRVSASLARARYGWQPIEGDGLHPLDELPALETRLYPSRSISDAGACAG